MLAIPFSPRPGLRKLGHCREQSQFWNKKGWSLWEQLLSLHVPKGKDPLLESRLRWSLRGVHHWLRPGWYLLELGLDPGPRGQRLTGQPETWDPAHP